MVEEEDPGQERLVPPREVEETRRGAAGSLVAAVGVEEAPKNETSE